MRRFYLFKINISDLNFVVDAVFCILFVVTCLAIGYIRCQKK